MILFVFEGAKQEPRIFQTMKYLFFKDLPENEIQVSYCTNIHMLYLKMRELDLFNGAADIVQLLREDQREHPEKGTNLLNTKNRFSQVFLFFDYDLLKIDKYNKKNIKEQNRDILKMLSYFNNETDKGKLYINYPMIESIRYVKKLPDENFYKYTAPIMIQRKFKDKAARFSYYPDLKFIAFNFDKTKKVVKIPKNISCIDEVRNNWDLLTDITVAKANYICSGSNVLPDNINLIPQNKIFKCQIRKYGSKCIRKVAIMNSFPLFLYEYFK